MTKLVNTIPLWPLLLGLLIGASLGAALGFFGQCTSGTCPLTSTWWRGALYAPFSGCSSPGRPLVTAAPLSNPRVITETSKPKQN